MLSEFRNQMSHSALRRAVPLLLVAAFMLGLLLAPALVDTSQAQSGIVAIDPTSQEVGVGSTGFVDVRSDGLTDIYGAQFTVTFDPGQLQVVDADPNLDGVQIIKGSCPAPDFVASNIADNAAGTVDYGAIQLATIHPDPCGGGVIGTIEFLCLDTPSIDPVTVPISITESIVSDPDGLPLPHTVQHGEIICIPGFQIVGFAVPQGHPGDATGVEVCLDGTECITTGANGYFQFVASEDQAHTITADFIHHLSAEMTGITGVTGEEVNIGTATLRAGDLNEDGRINILDLVMVGGNFDDTEPTPWEP